MSHDQNFKNLILDYPRQALEFFAPLEVAGITRVARIVPLRQEQLKERLGDRFRELDVPLLVEWPDGRCEAVRGLVSLEPDSEKQRKYIDFIDIYAGLDDNEIERYMRSNSQCDACRAFRVLE